MPLVQLEEERSKAYRTVTLKDRIKSKKIDAIDPYIVVEPQDVIDVCSYLKNDARLSFGILNCISGVDYLEPDAKKDKFRIRVPNVRSWAVGVTESLADLVRVEELAEVRVNPKSPYDYANMYHGPM